MCDPLVTRLALVEIGSIASGPQSILVDNCTRFASQSPKILPQPRGPGKLADRYCIGRDDAAEAETEGHRNAIEAALVLGSKKPVIAVA